MKALLYTLGGLAVGTGIFFAIRSQITPNFYIEEVDNLTKTGKFVFSGIKNSFGIGSSKSVVGRNGFVVTTGSDDGKTVYFKLYKNGNFVADLKRISF
jgi:hypothetical protein